MIDKCEEWGIGRGTPPHQNRCLGRGGAKFVKIVRRKSVKSCVVYLTKKTTFRLPLKPSLRRGSRPKSAMPPPTCWLTTFQISSKSVNFRRSYSRPREDRFLGPLVNPILAQSDTLFWANNETRPNVMVARGYLRKRFSTTCIETCRIANSIGDL